jgi:valyl-tRNA synthetase
MQQFRLSEALKTIYSLIWDDFCSWYLEWIKPEYGKSISKNVYEKSITFFDHLLQLLHPFMPFITEEIYHLLKERSDDLAVKQFQPVEKFDSEILQEGLKLKNVITSIRDAKNKNNLKPKEPVSVFIETAEESSYHLIKQILAKQTNADKIVFNEAPASSAIMTVAGNEKIYIESDAAIDSSVQIEKLNKDLNYLKGFLITIDKKLSNDKFVNNARPEVIELERKKKSDTESKIDVIQQTLASINP